MRNPEMLRLIQSGAILPEAEIILELGFPPAKITVKLKAGDVKKLMLDTKTVSAVLRRCFVQRRILHERLEAEGRDLCVKSAEEIVSELRTAQKDISEAGANAALVVLLQKWENVSVSARQNLQGAAMLPNVLREYRITPYRLSRLL
ncbi:MAG: hypothetical protein M3178_01170 [Pseudomonadota bacterium]|nr:hypothetical protein [Pseudomonadota bacterium]